jgi:hypothetical protein
MKRSAFFLGIALIAFSCGDPTENTATTDSMAPPLDSAAIRNIVANDTSNIRDTVFHTALPPVFDGDIIMQNNRFPESELLHQLMGVKYNHVGLIFQRERDGLLMVLEMQDTLRATPLTEFVDRGIDGHVCLLRLKNADKTLNEEKTKALRDAARGYRKKPFDPVLNWDDAGLYSSEMVWKVYNNAMRLTLCPTRKVKDFDISPEKQAEMKKTYKKNVSNADEAVSIDDIYNSQKLEIVFEK